MPEHKVEPSEDGAAEPGAGRLVFFSDAVYAIAITLLVIDLRLVGSGELDSPALAQALWSMWPQLLSYVLSFLVIGSLWGSHHRKFRYINRYDGRLVWLNLLLLMVIAFIPFPTSVLAESGNSGHDLLLPQPLPLPACCRRCSGGIPSRIIW